MCWATFRDQLVVVGSWVPELLFPERSIITNRPWQCWRNGCGHTQSRGWAAVGAYHPRADGRQGKRAVGDQQWQAFDDPLAAVVVVFARERVHGQPSGCRVL